METRRRRWGRRALACATVLAIATAGAACKQQHDPEVEGYGLPDSSSAKTALPPMAKRCKLDEAVKAPAKGTPEATIQALYGAAVGKDDQAHLQSFQDQFSSSQNRSWIKTGYWPKARKYVRKYLPSDYKDGDPVTFTVCRRKQRSDGSVTLYIRANDPKKSNVPITLEKNDKGVWKVTSYTP